MILHLPFYRWENWGKLTKEADDSGKWPESENRNCLWNQQWWSGDSDSTALIHHCSMLVLFRSPPPRQAVFSFRQELPFLENSAVVTASVKLCMFAIGLGNSIMGLQQSYKCIRGEAYLSLQIAVTRSLYSDACRMLWRLKWRLFQYLRSKFVRRTSYSFYQSRSERGLVQSMVSNDLQA